MAYAWMVRRSWKLLLSGEPGGMAAVALSSVSVLNPLTN